MDSKTLSPAPSLALVLDPIISPVPRSEASISSYDSDVSDVSDVSDISDDTDWVPSHSIPTLSPVPSLALVLAPIISPVQQSETSIWSYDSYDSEDTDNTHVNDSDDDSVQVIKVSPSAKLEIVLCGLTKCRKSVTVKILLIIAIWLIR